MSASSRASSSASFPSVLRSTFGSSGVAVLNVLSPVAGDGSVYSLVKHICTVDNALVSQCVDTETLRFVLVLSAWILLLTRGWMCAGNPR